MTVIGLTGPSGAGKGAVSSCLSARGIPCIDCDQVYHALLTPDSPCVKEIVSVFGDQVLAPDGALDRSRLSALVFQDASKLVQLNHITHKYVLKQVKELLTALEQGGNRIAVIDAPTLFESGADKLCQVTVAITADRATRIRRIMERDGISYANALARVQAQPEDAFYQTHAGLVISNDHGLEQLEAAVDEKLHSLGLLS